MIPIHRAAFPIAFLFCCFAGNVPARQPNAAFLPIDGFEDGDTLSEAGTSWTTFSKDGGASIAANVVDSADGGKELEVGGVLPDDGTGATWGGVFCDLSPDGATPRDLSGFERLDFSVRTKSPGLYRVRIEDAVARENSTNVFFPAVEAPNRISIPLWRFRSGTARAVRIVFARAEDRPGDPLHLVLDDVRLETAAAGAADALQATSLPWAPSLTVAWEEARRSGRPLLMYFTSGVASRCRDFERDVMAGEEFRSAANLYAMLAVDVSAGRDLSERFGIYRVPAFVTMDPETRASVVLDPERSEGPLPSQLRRIAATVSAREVAPVARAAVRIPSTATALIDDFSDGNFLNRANGKWGAFSRGDNGDIVPRLILAGAGNFAFEAFGRLPAAPDGATWGGIFCDLSPDGATPRDLRAFRTIEFQAWSDKARRCVLKIENAPSAHDSAAVAFDAQPQPQTFRIPLAAFASGVDQATRVAWLPADPAPGADFRLVVDNLSFSR